MKFLKHILVVVALLMAMVPCVHAEEHHVHEHGGAAQLCMLDSSPCECHSGQRRPCECHSCEHRSCPDDVEIQFNLSPVLTTIAPPSISAPCFFPIDTRLSIPGNLPPVSGILAALQTVQLLI